MYILGIQRNKLEWFNNDRFMGIVSGCFLSVQMLSVK